jgi:hypothetical protein
MRRASATCELRHNMSIDTDPKQQKAASPHSVLGRSFLR